MLDDLDVALLTALHGHPRIGDLELSRVTSVARATVHSRLRRLEESGVITSWGPDVDARGAGFPVQAFVTLEIAQGALDQVQGVPGRRPRGPRGLRHHRVGRRAVQDRDRVARRNCRKPWCA